MPAYHSKYVDTADSYEVACGCSILPLKTATRGPAPPCAQEEEDIVDETINFFRANVFFRNFDVHTGPDRTLVYLTLYLQQCLGVIDKAATKQAAQTQLTQLARAQFPAPGEQGWALGTIFPSAERREAGENFKNYFKQCREELGNRLLEQVFVAGGAKSKWWMFFTKRKFLNKELK